MVSLTLLVAALCVAGSFARPWMNPNDDPATRAHKLLVQMNLAEKVNMLYGVGGPYVGTIQGNTRLGIPELLMNDGPQGFRAPDNLKGTSTAWPCGLGMATTWDTELAYAWGQAMGQEFTDKGANIQLGPGVNVARVPLNGRNFEYISGEDPVLGATMVAPVIKGIQSKGVIANAKHYVQNNQETNRGFVSENVDERTQWEIYYPPFESAVDAGVLSIMCSYNKINNVWACENNFTLTTSLKEKMGFKGWVMSDWGATHTTVLAANAGLDQQMPDGSFFHQPLIDAVNAGTVSQATIDDKVMRILTAMFQIGLFDTPRTGDLHNNVTSVAHNQLARAIAAAGAVLVKNDRVLPLPSTPIKIAVIGDWANSPTVAGHGSGAVAAPYIISPLLGITVRAGTQSKVTFVPSSDVSGAVQAARDADYAVVVTGTVSGEGSDRKNLALPQNDDDLIAQVAAVQAKTIAVVICPGAVLMPWSKAAGAIINMFMPGQEAGNALADVLFGDVNPSGRLPLTMPNKENEVDFTQSQYPGLPAINPAQATYSERLEIGYRWYNAHNVTPNFSFGHGLSYTTFGYSNLALAKNAQGSITVTFNLANTGSVDGAEVAQVYIGYPSIAGEPAKQLRAFQKVNLAQGHTAELTFGLSQRDISIWDVNTHAWDPQGGAFSVFVGASLADIRLQGQITL